MERKEADNITGIFGNLLSMIDIEMGGRKTGVDCAGEATERPHGRGLQHHFTISRYREEFQKI